MAGEEFHLVAQREERIQNRVHQGRVVTPLQIGAADRLAEERIAREGHLLRLAQERHTARRMARRGDYLQCRLPEVHLLGRREVDIDRGHIRGGDAVDIPRSGSTIQEVLILRRAGKGNLIATLEVVHTQHMIEVAVGIDRQDGLQPMLGDEVIERSLLGGCRSSAIDHGTLVRFVPQDVCILPDGVEDKGCNFHRIHIFDKDS